MSRPPVTLAQAQQILPSFGVTPTRVAPLGRGLINDTFAVDTDDAAFVLQRVHPVFAPEIHLNIRAVTEHLAGRGMLTPRLCPTPAGALWVERDGEVWRLMTRMPGVSFDAARGPAQAHAAAALLARFHSALDDLEHTFVGRRTGVHDTPAHLARLEAAVSEHGDHRLYDPVARLHAAITTRAAELPPLHGLRPRIVHGDPKLNNIMFESTAAPGCDHALCLIDLDTVAPMPLALELGDAWRSWCNPRGEDDQVARFELPIYEASLHGYLGACTLSLGADEREALLHGVEWITLELAARFAADALYEQYFGWDRDRFPAAGEHNLVRAQGQWSLHEAVMAVRPQRAAALREPARTVSHTFAEYLALEASSEVKHEHVNGEIFAMAGGTLEHSRIAANVILELGSQLRGRACVVYTSDARVRVRATGLATYPDASIVCGAIERDPEDANTLTNPVVLVEVLSDSTEAYDRGEKFAHYQRIPSLREYVLVSQRGRRIDHYLRNDDGTWTFRSIEPPGSLSLPSIDCVLSLDAVYRDPLAGPAAQGSAVPSA